MKIKRLTAILLLALLLLSALSSCKDEKQPEQTLPEEESTTIPFSQTGIVLHGEVSADNLPNDAALTEWYERAIGRTQLTNAIFYAKDPTDGLWHCWLYVGAYLENDTIELGAMSSDGTVYIRHTAADTTASGATRVFYFTVDRADEPTFEMVQNNDTVGLLLTLGEAAVKSD